MVTEGMLAWVAFAGLNNPCVKLDLRKDEDPPADGYTFPCRVSGLYNQNFLDIPGLG